MSYQRIRLEEREEIFRLRYLEHLTMKQIGEILGRDKSSISRELKRGTKNRIYSPPTGGAHKRNMRKLQCPKLKVTDELWVFAKPKLEKRRQLRRLRDGWRKSIIIKRARERYIIIVL
jgi:IS30 family transposase